MKTHREMKKKKKEIRIPKECIAINDHIVFPNTQLVHSLNVNTLKKPRVFRLTFHSDLESAKTRKKKKRKIHTISARYRVTARTK